MRDIMALWCGTPSKDKCKICGSSYYPECICPKCRYKTIVTNVCRKCMVNMVITGRESHTCKPRPNEKFGRRKTRKIKGYVNQGTIYELPDHP